MYDITSIGELLIDLTQVGVNEQGVGLFAANPGGAPANVAVAAARLGCRCSFLGKVGRDGFGDSLLHTLQSNGVDPSNVYRGEQATTMAVVTISPSGERSFRFLRGADQSLTVQEVAGTDLSHTKFLHFGSVSLTPGASRSATLFAARQARSAGALISYDPNFRPSLWDSRKSAVQWMALPLPLVDILKLSDEELPLIAHTSNLEKGTLELSGLGVRLIMVTLGAKGVYYRWGDSTGLVPGARTIKSVLEDATASDIEELGVEPGSKIVVLERIRYANEVPVAIEFSRLPERFSFLIQEDLNDASLIQVLAEKYNVHFTGTGIKTLKLVYATYEQAKYLSLSKNYPLISISCVSCEANGQPCHRSLQLIVGDRFELYF